VRGRGRKKRNGGKMGSRWRQSGLSRCKIKVEQDGKITKIQEAGGKVAGEKLIRTMGVGSSCGPQQRLKPLTGKKE